jgi:hypothetical protein
VWNAYAFWSRRRYTRWQLAIWALWSRTAYNRWQMLILTLGTGAGTTLLAGAPRPGSLEELLPPAVVTTWAVMLTLGCLIGMVAVLARRPAVLRVGMTLLAGATLEYWTALAGTAGWARAVALGWPILAFGACAAGDVIAVTRSAHRGGEVQ